MFRLANSIFNALMRILVLVFFKVYSIFVVTSEKDSGCANLGNGTLEVEVLLELESLSAVDEIRREFETIINLDFTWIDPEFGKN